MHLGSGEIALVNDEGARCRVSVAGRFRSNQLATLHHQARAGLGVVILPLPIAAEDVHHGALVPVLSAWKSDPVPIHLVYLKQRFATVKVRAFVEFAMRTLGPDAFGEHDAQARSRAHARS